jgi:hypothetical protein
MEKLGFHYESVGRKSVSPKDAQADSTNAPFNEEEEESKAQKNGQPKTTKPSTTSKAL